MPGTPLWGFRTCFLRNLSTKCSNTRFILGDKTLEINRINLGHHCWKQILKKNEISENWNKIIYWIFTRGKVQLKKESSFHLLTVFFKNKQTAGVLHLYSLPNQILKEIYVFDYVFAYDIVWLSLSIQRPCVWSFRNQNWDQFSELWKNVSG